MRAVVAYHKVGLLSHCFVMHLNTAHVKKIFAYTKYGTVGFGVPSAGSAGRLAASDVIRRPAEFKVKRLLSLPVVLWPWDRRTFISIPYIQGVSEQVTRILRPYAQVSTRPAASLTTKTS